GEGEEGAGGWRAGGGLPHEEDAAVQRWVGEAEPDQPGGALQPGRGQDRDADVLGRQLDHHAKIAGLGPDAGRTAGRVAGRLQVAAQLARPGERDHRLGAERAQRYLPAAGERVGWVDGNYDRFPGNEQHFEAGRRAIVAALADQGGVQLAGGERG